MVLRHVHDALAPVVDCGGLLHLDLGRREVGRGQGAGDAVVGVGSGAHCDGVRGAEARLPVVDEQGVGVGVAREAAVEDLIASRQGSLLHEIGDVLLTLVRGIATNAAGPLGDQVFDLGARGSLDHATVKGELLTVAADLDLPGVALFQAVLAEALVVHALIQVGATDDGGSLGAVHVGGIDFGRTSATMPRTPGTSS